MSSGLSGRGFLAQPWKTAEASTKDTHKGDFRPFDVAIAEQQAGIAGILASIAFSRSQSEVRVEAPLASRGTVLASASRTPAINSTDTHDSPRQDLQQVDGNNLYGGTHNTCVGRLRM